MTMEEKSMDTVVKWREIEREREKKKESLCGKIAHCAVFWAYALSQQN